MAAEFTHLHLHTDYSLLDGACDVDKLAAHLNKIGQTAAAMTDHGNIYGAVHFFDAMKKKNIKPILGCELYLSETDNHRELSGGYNHFLVLAENEEGYRNLVPPYQRGRTARLLSQAPRVERVSFTPHQGPHRLLWLSSG